MIAQEAEKTAEVGTRAETGASMDWEACNGIPALPGSPIKRSIDSVSALVLLLLVGPVILLAAVLVRCTSRGPAFYSQVRVGWRGVCFTIYKLRTMKHNCEDLTGAQWAKPGDSRITPIGRILRRTHLDELPQLWNVLLGHMSLIGPRPERPEFVPALARQVPRYPERLAVLPGLSGLAQLQLPPDTDLESVRRKLICDLHYVYSRNWWLDVRLMVGTVAYLAGIHFPTSNRVLRLPTFADLSAEEGIVSDPERMPMAIPATTPVHG